MRWFYRWKGRLRGWWGLPNGIVIDDKAYLLSWRGRLLLKLSIWAGRRAEADAYKVAR